MTEQMQDQPPTLLHIEDDGPPTNPRPKAVEYWGVDTTFQWMLPDGKQFIEHQKLSEGHRAKYQKRTSRDLIMDRDGSGRIRTDAAGDRHELLKAAVSGWSLLRGGQPVAYSDRLFEEWLQRADPMLVDELEKDIRKKNPWLSSDLSSTEIRKEIASLSELLIEVEERERGEGSSSTR